MLLVLIFFIEWLFVAPIKQPPSFLSRKKEEDTIIIK